MLYIQSNDSIKCFIKAKEIRTSINTEYPTERERELQKALNIVMLTFEVSVY